MPRTTDTTGRVRVVCPRCRRTRYISTLTVLNLKGRDPICRRCVADSQRGNADHIRRSRTVAVIPTRPPAAPTNAQPGSEEKLAVLEQRAASGEYLYHKDDATNRMTAIELLVWIRAVCG